ncbi:MAG TPA: type II secretion system F family protein [Actinomycetota bacterium]
MPDTFEYRVRDQAGKVVTGTLVAENEQLVVHRLREMGYVPLKVGVQNLGMKREFNFRQKAKLKDLAVFSRQFATMVNSGLPILRALSILEQQTDSRPIRTAVTEVRGEIERGSSLSAAMSKHPKVFNNLYVAMVRSGETGGVLESVLERLSDNLEREVALRQKIKSAMTYPVVVLGFVTLILAGMLIFIVPQFKSIYATLHGKLPLPTLILLKVSDLMVHKAIFLIIGLVVVAVLVRRYIKTPQGRAQWDALKLKVPIFGPLFHKTALARFSRVLGVLNRSGVPILQSLEVTAEVVNNSQISKAIMDVQQAVKQGETLSKPLGRHGVFPPMVVQMLAVGEETGAIDTMLDKVAMFYDNEVSATVDSLTSLIEPVMIFFVGGAVGLAVIALYLPMFNIINLIK